MEKRAFVGLGILAFAALAYAAKAAASTAPGYAWDGSLTQSGSTDDSIALDWSRAPWGAWAVAPSGDESYNPPMTYAPTIAEENAAKLAAFMALLRQYESGGDYSILYGGGHFDDFSRHPNIRVPFHNPRKAGAGMNDVSTAAGAYQFIFTTWSEIAQRTGLADFSPASQDAAAAWKLRRLGVVDALEANNPEGALRLASGTWASLPGSTAGQGPRGMTESLALYNALLGVA